MKDGMERYRRQLQLIGKSGQESLKKATATVVGLGGLGSPAATYLTLAGLGKLILVDHDKVTQSNLNRQFLHWDKDRGGKKTESARKKLKKLNPELTLEILSEKITSQTIKNIPSTDLLIGAVDNFRVRYLLNEFAVKNKLPYIHGAIEGFQGQLTTVIPDESPCLRCIFPDPPPEKDELPVFGTAAGVIGTMMANEGIKYLTGKGNLLTGRLLLMDITGNNFDTVDLEKNPDCPVCGTDRH